MKLFLVPILLALSNLTVASPIMESTVSHYPEDPIINHEVVNVALEVCENRKLYHQRFWKDIREAVTLCDSNQIVTCRSLLSNCIASLGVFGVTTSLSAAAYAATLFGCGSGPAYCGNCFALLRKYQGICSEPRITHWLRNVAFKPQDSKEQGTVDDAEYASQDINGSGDSKNVAPTLNQPFDGELSTGTAPSDINVPGIDDTLADAEGSVADETEQKGLGA